MAKCGGCNGTVWHVQKAVQLFIAFLIFSCIAVGQPLPRQQASPDQIKQGKTTKHGPPPGATVYDGLYVNEPLRDINMKETHCFNEVGSALDALIQEHLDHSCVIFSEDGSSLDHFTELTTTSLSGVQESITGKFGSPLPGKVHLVDTDGPPQWRCWRVKDGTYILIRGNTSHNKHTGRITNISEIVVMKRWQEQSAP